MKFVSLFAGLLLASREAAAFTAPRPSTAHAHSTSTARPRPTALSVLPESLDLLAAVSSSSLLSADNVVSPEPIHTAFTVATFFSQPFFLLMILAPQAKTTKQIMGGLEIPLACCLIHFFIVAASLVADGSAATAPLAEFNQVFDPAGDPQRAFMGMVRTYPNFVSEEWSHVLTWDLFVGRYIWLDGLRRGIFTGPAVLFCNLIGPPGLLLHWLTCALSGKPLFEPSEKEEIENL